MNTVVAQKVADLLAEREQVTEELAHLAVIDEPVRAAEDAVAAVDRAIATLDADERSRSEEWAAGAVGELPAPRNAERAGLVKRRIELQSDLDAARNRAGAIVPRRTTLNAEVRRIDHSIFAAKLRGVIEEARRQDALAHDLAKEMRAPIAKVVALRLTLSGEILSAAQNSGDKAAERLVGEAIDALNWFAMPEIGGEFSSLPRFAQEWREALR